MAEDPKSNSASRRSFLAQTSGLLAVGPVSAVGRGMPSAPAAALATGRKNVLSWEVNGSAGLLRWSLEYPNSLLACLEDLGDRSLSGFTEISVTDGEHPYAGAWWPSGHTLGWEHAHIIEKFHFLGAIASGAEMSPCIATFEDGYRVAVIIAAMKEWLLRGIYG